MKKLTSDSNPIRVDFLPSTVVMLPGRIGMTIAPGKKIRGIYGDWDRDLEKDLRRIRCVHGVSVLVCLVPPEELALLGISELPGMAQGLEFEVVQFPIQDVSVPDSIDRLRDLVVHILGAAAVGKTVVIHCRGGLGRSGLVAACCLVARGMDDRTAMDQVRATREGTIETPAQEQLVREFRRKSVEDPGWLRDRIGQARVDDDSRPPFSRFLGCLLGGAVGDALGYPVEFVGSAASIIDRFGANPPARLDFARPGEALISDDTQMTLFVAEGVIRAIQRINDRGLASVPGVIGRALLRWYETQTFTRERSASIEANGWLRTDARLYARRAPGNTCLSSLELLSGREPPSPPLNNSKGCGAVMRSAPIGLAACERAGAFEVACESGAQTHGHPLGYLPAGYLASVVSDVARGMGLAEAMNQADELLRREAAEGGFPGAESRVPGHDEAHRRGARDLLECVNRARVAARSVRVPTSSEVEALGGGWTGEEALAISLFCALTVREGNPDAVARALWASVAHGGDSDSTGAITGNILGAAYGVEALPRAWVERVELRDTIERIAGDLYAVALGHIELDHQAYPPY